MSSFNQKKHNCAQARGAYGTMYTQVLNIDSAVDLSKLPAHLAVRLQQIKAGTIEVNQNHVSFTGGLFGSGRNRWDILVPFGFGGRDSQI
jgi:hypothetical protein